MTHKPTAEKSVRTRRSASKQPTSDVRTGRTLSENGSHRRTGRAPSLQPSMVYAVAFVMVLVIAFVGVSALQTRQAEAQTANPTPLPLFALPDARAHRAFSSGSMALDENTRTLVVANLLSNSVSIVLPAQERVAAEVPVGADPRTVAITPDGARALVANRGDGTLSIVDIRAAAVIATIELGVYPYGVVVGENGRAYVTLQGAGEVVEVDIDNAVVLRRFPAPNMPTGIALWGDFLYVTHFWSGDVSQIYIPSGQIVARANTGGANGISQSITLDITRGTAYLPQTLSNPYNQALTFDSAAAPMVNTLDLRALTTVRAARIPIDQRDRPVNMPFAVALDRFQQRLYIVSAGSDSLSVIDLNDGRVRGHIEVGASPRAVILNRDNTLAYIHNAFDATITTVQTSNLTIADVLPVSAVNLPTDQLIGGQLFYNATDRRTSRDSWISCANCHFDGMSDGRVWQGFNGTGRNTPLLFGLGETAPYNWEGDWDELADVEIKLRDLQGGAGLIDLPQPNAPEGDPHAGLSVDLDSLVAYLTSLPTPSSPYADGDAEIVAQGEAVFNEQGCAGCHGAPTFTSLQPADVGTGGAFDTPSLRWLWMSAPYFHDGRAATLADLFMQPGDHQLVGEVSQDELDALIAYLLTLE
jgi:YVTN family beta-propeller protein